MVTVPYTTSRRAAEFNSKLVDFITWHKETDVQTSVTKMSTYSLDVGNAGKKPKGDRELHC